MNTKKEFCCEYCSFSSHDMCECMKHEQSCTYKKSYESIIEKMKKGYCFKKTYLNGNKKPTQIKYSAPFAVNGREVSFVQMTRTFLENGSQRMGIAIDTEVLHMASSFLDSDYCLEQFTNVDDRYLGDDFLYEDITIEQMKEEVGEIYDKFMSVMNDLLKRGNEE